MTGAIAHEQAQRLRAAVEAVFDTPARGLGHRSLPEERLLRLVDVLEAGPDATVFPSDEALSTQQAADILGVSRMTVVRLIDRGELAVRGGGVHRRVAAAEIDRYRAASAARRRSALRRLAQEIDDETPADRVVTTR